MGDRNLHASEVEAEATLALIQLIRLQKAWVGEWFRKNQILYITSIVSWMGI